MIRLFKKAYHLYRYRNAIKEGVLIVSLVYIYLLYNNIIDLNPKREANE